MIGPGEMGPVETHRHTAEQLGLRKPCVHDSSRTDGTLDCNCLRCGADGYWHDGHRHDVDHPSGKVLVRLECPA